MTELNRRNFAQTLGAILLTSQITFSAGCTKNFTPPHITEFNENVAEYNQDLDIYHVILRDGMQYIAKEVPVQNQSIMVFAPAREVQTIQGGTITRETSDSRIPPVDSRNNSEEKTLKAKLHFETMYAPRIISNVLSWNGKPTQDCDPEKESMTFKKVKYQDAREELEDKALGIAGKEFYFIKIARKLNEEKYFEPFEGGDHKWEGEAGMLHQLRGKNPVKALPFYMTRAEENKVRVSKNPCTGLIILNTPVFTLEAVSQQQLRDFSNTSAKHDIKANNYYQIQTGDTLSQLALKFNTSMGKLVDLNYPKITDVRKIYAGDVIRVGD